MEPRTFDINLCLPAEHIAAGYVDQLVADVLGPGATIDVSYSDPDEAGLVCVVGSARAG